jgi:hypothetical protein
MSSEVIVSSWPIFPLLSWLVIRLCGVYPLAYHVITEILVAQIELRLGCNVRISSAGQEVMWAVDPPQRLSKVYSRDYR